MHTLKEQYIEAMKAYIATLDPTALSSFYRVCFQVSKLAREYDLNTDQEIDDAVTAMRPPPYGSPEDWLSLRDFLSIVFETYGAAHQDDQ